MRFGVHALACPPSRSNGSTLKRGYRTASGLDYQLAQEIAGTEIVGVQVLNYKVDWEKSLISSRKKDESLMDLASRAAKPIEGYDVLSGSGKRSTVSFRGILSQWYFAASPGDSAPYSIKPKSMSIKDGVLQLDYENSQNVKASVCFDIRTHKLVKVTEEDKQVFPKK